MSKNLQRICILSGPSNEVDLSRARTGIRYRESLGFKVPFRILGAGPDLYKVLGYLGPLEDGDISKEEYSKRIQGLDHHLDLYEFLTDETGEDIETVTSSVTLVQNVLHGFRENSPLGSYAIVTEPWHYQKFRQIELSLKRNGKISQRLEFFNVPSPDENYYGPARKLASWAKTVLELARV